MKLLSCLLFIFPVFLYAQPRNDWSAFSRVIKATDIAGKKFKLEAAVKVQLIDSTAEAELWARVDKTNKKMGFFYNMTDKPIRSNNWAVYTINGKIDKDAAYLVIGGLFSRRGIFYFDHFRLWVERAKNQFEEIPLPNGDFEEDSLQNWSFFKNPGFKMAQTNDTAFHGNKSIKVDGSAFKARPTFGTNDSVGQYALVNGITIYYELYGEGEPLLLLHGNSASINSFKLQIPELSKKYKVIAVDTRGQGKSGDDGKTYTYDLFAADMNALLDYLHIDSANIVGWSDGGNTGLIMAMKYPAKVKKLATMGANVFIDKTVVVKLVFKVIDQQLKELKNDTTAWAKNRIRLINMLLTEPRYSFDDLKTIHCPVLVMAGENDLIKPGHTRQIAEHITGSTLLIAPKETHDYPTENAASFNKAVLDFFGRP
ncbi:alpha/beta fold hydrolase [Chitinophaga ginsengisoli]|uniref:Pimeloyl-ACP methyl ester carboxylesterase n=1 Tax=Chitinophaga ginsengisoli TaxID=363837 RepID=A0A2P8GLW9_9BACT|nr:alpha/beta hydrolase [Chitinophaga ginsengisoli]PSL34968.1 pimeloyl-ACP methyl ester carboxylesterase [Chitinophaga ginsengisoli]